MTSPLGGERLNPGSSASAQSRNPVVLLTVNTAWNVVIFRAGLVRSLLADGYDVVAVAPPDPHVSGILSLGSRYAPINIDGGGTNPLRDFALLWNYFLVLRRERPSAVLAFTAKPNIYASLASRTLGIPVINNIAGLGTAFLRRSWLNTTVRSLYRLSLSKSPKVFFQNAEDMSLFLRAGIVRENQAEKLPGSGVDPLHFSPRAKPLRDGRPFRFLFVGRLLWDKGVGDLVEATRQLRAEGFDVETRILGLLDVKNPSAIKRSQMEQWVSERVVRYLGEAHDVRPAIAEVDCVVLPSNYPEGTPRSLLEAASMAKPIITTDAPGCRDVVVDGASGYLVPVRDVSALAGAMKRMAELPDVDLARMGERSRALVEERYDERFVIAAYRNALKAAIGPNLCPH